MSNYRKLPKSMYINYKDGMKPATQKIVAKFKYMYENDYNYRQAIKEVHLYTHYALKEIYPEHKLNKVQVEAFCSGFTACLLSIIDCGKVADCLYMTFLRTSKKERIDRNVIYTAEFQDSFNVAVKYFKNNLVYWV